MGSRIPLFGLGQAARSPFVTAKVLQNLYCEQRPQGEKSSLVAYGTPGLELFVDFGATPCRGAIEFEKNSVAYVVHRGTFYEVNNAGVTTVRGALATTAGRVSMAHNGVQVMIVDGTNGYIYNTVTLAFVQVVSFLFANPTTVCFLARRFVCSFSGSGRFQWSDVDNGLVFQALSFSNAETNPDPVVAVYSSNGQLILAGTGTFEFWGISGAEDAPFVLLNGTATAWGLAATWSLVDYDNSFACLLAKKGQVMLAKMNGYVPEKISSVDLDYILNRYSSTSDATAYSYILAGHLMFVVSFPSAGESWLIDGTTRIPTKLKSFGLTRHRAEFSFNLVGATIVADYSSGRLYRLTADALTDNGDSIEAEIVGETIANPDQSVLSVDCLRLDMEVGVGTTTGQGVNPQIALSISRDNGKTFGPDMWKTAGALGEYQTRVEWRRLGGPRFFTPKLKITDPVRRVFVSACLNPDD